MSLKLTLEIHAENAKDLPEWVQALFGGKDVKTAEVAASPGSERVVGPVSEGQVTLDVAADEEIYVLREGQESIPTSAEAPPPGPSSQESGEKLAVPKRRRRRTKAEMEAARAAEAGGGDEAGEPNSPLHKSPLESVQMPHSNEHPTKGSEMVLDGRFDKDVYELSHSLTPDRVAQLNAGREFISQYGLPAYDRLRDHLGLGRSPIADKDDEVLKHRAAMQVYISRKSV